jgi:hypothetical protein
MKFMMVLVVATINKVNNDVFFQLYADDGLPGQVCQRCTRLVNLSYNFKLQCESSDATLRQYLKSQSFQVNVIGQ